MKQLTVEIVKNIESHATKYPVTSEFRINEFPNLYARKNQNAISLIFRAEAAGNRIVKKIGAITDSIDLLNQRLLRLYNEVAYLKGETSAPLTLSAFITLYFIPHSEINHRDHKGMLSRLRIIAPAFGPLADRPITEITKFDCIQLIERLRKRGVSPNTLNKYRYALQAIFRLAVEMELIERNPVSKIKKERVSNILDRVLRGEELKYFIIFSSKYSNPYAGGALLFLLFTGMRAMEALTMKWSYLSPDKSYIDLPLTKSGKPRRVQLNNSAKAVLEHLETLRMNDYVFFSNATNGHISYPRNALNWVCDQLSKKGVLNGHLTLHSLRHSFATNLIEATGSLYVTQIALGHSSSAVTERYTHLSNQHINDSVLQLDTTFNYSR
ncbi:hypothetical protein CYL31_14970 [Marinomonas sp. A3A]|uniref:tyrosine-type recombinase/integrase n=1 Tax=Marinomonas sp. A3A TaxID=2065312 RepID=UPI001BB3834B|nr:site-specific integrase [Marinomonas sp. A3A]QUX92619.1 hypothetical protein CYL31_14970 [Marinomonas sp. A3A]